MSDFEKFREELPSNEKFYSSLTGKKNCWQRIWSYAPNLEKIWNKTDKRLSPLVVKMRCFRNI